MHFITSAKRKKAVMPVLRLVNWLNPKVPTLMVQIRHLLRQKRFAHLNPPRDLNEKILWMALYSDTTEWSRLADKHEVRKFVEDCGLKDILIKQYGVWNSAYDIDFDKLPSSFIIKSTHGSGDAVIVRDKTKVDLKNICFRIQSGLDEHLVTSSAELHYARIPHRVVVEELLENDYISEKYSTTMIDYKIWCFNGKASYIMVITNRGLHCKDGADMLVYDRYWNAHPEYCRKTPDFCLAQEMPKPSNYKEMLEKAEILAQGFPLVRVDLYNLNGKIYFGEMTFTSYGGIMDYYSEMFLQKAGSEIDLSGVEKVKSSSL